MPLIRGAKPDSKGFGLNIEREIAAGKTKKQAVAIAYAESKLKSKMKPKKTKK